MDGWMDGWMDGSVLMAPSLTPRHRGTVSVTRGSQCITSLKKARVVEEEEVMGWGWLKIFLLVELIDEWIDGSISLAPRCRGPASSTKRSWAMRVLKKAGVVEEEEGGHEPGRGGEVGIDAFIELIN